MTRYDDYNKIVIDFERRRLDYWQKKKKLLIFLFLFISYFRNAKPEDGG